MNTFQQFDKTLENIPVHTSWYLAELGEAKGRQELFTRQSSQKLKILREHALIESAVSSNRIEGAVIDKKRAGTVVFGKSHLKDRSEEEVRSYRIALDWIHREGIKIPVSEKTVLKLHKISRGEIWDAGKYKEKNVDIIEKLPGGRERIRFKTVSASKTPTAMKKLMDAWRDSLKEKKVHPLILMAAFNLDFLCIHPFRDGNGRVSRLLLLLQCYSLGYEVGRYVSLERLIEQNKERYYETLEQSSQSWHGGKHDPWPYVNYLLFVLKSAYREFEQKVNETSSPKGAKTELVLNAINRTEDTFRISDLRQECPGVSMDLIRQLLKKLRASESLQCLGRGQHAEWRKTRKWRIG